MEIDKEIIDEIDHVSDLVVKKLKETNSVLMNIQIEAEYSQYDVLFSYNFSDYGRHQRGVSANDLIIGIVGYGCFGFKVEIADTDPGYYKEKLGVHSNYLAFLFNEIRKKLKELK